jgi:hypothetical protein
MLRKLHPVLVAMALLIWPASLLAQEATISGTVTDESGGALPGVVIRAVHEASGNSFEGITDGRGDFRLSMRIGAYRLTAELPGFAPLQRQLSLLVGQTAVVNLKMAVSSLQETITVTGDAPLLDVTASSLGGNIDSRQMAELPVNGRAWVDLVMLAPGARVNHVTSDAPSDSGLLGPSSARKGGDFELNVDGQQITVLITGTNQSAQPRFSRDIIAEFELLSSRFDATQGRSSGLQVNAVTKSGSNLFSGTMSGYFRDDKFNAADPVALRVLDYQDTQFSATFGGPLLKDRLHFFGNYEYESEPLTFLYNTPFPQFNMDRSREHIEKKSALKFDAQFSPRTRLMVRWNASWSVAPQGGGSSSTPSTMVGYTYDTAQTLATLTHVFSDRVVNEFRAGNTYYLGDQMLTYLTNPRARVVPNTGPQIQLQGFNIGGIDQTLDRQMQNVHSVRNDLTLSFSKAGRHTVRVGAEYLHQLITDRRCVRCEGLLEATGGPIPANITALFPDQFDVRTWNLDPLSAISLRWRQSIGDRNTSEIPRYTSAAWIQDDWAVSSKLTLNLGVRYDLELNAFANDIVMLPWLTGNQPNDTNNVGPRAGFTYTYNDRTVVRGGYGLYFGTVQNNHFGKYYEQTIPFAINNDGRPDFASNPHNGPDPTYQQLLARVCTASLQPGCIRREAPTGGAVFAPDFHMPYAHQFSIGMQRQIGTSVAVEADYVYQGMRDHPRDLPVNIAYNQATGANYPFSDVARRPFPEWGYVSLTVNGHRSNRHALQTAVIKRFSRGWQASGTYTLSVMKDADPLPVVPQQRSDGGVDLVPVGFATAPDLGGEYTLAVGDQRHRAVFNSIWQMPWGFQLSGLYFFGSGMRYPTQWGVDLRQIGSNRPNSLRLRPDGSIVPRNSFVGDQIHRVDMRLQRRFPIARRASIDAILEMYNAFNRANFGSFTTSEVNAAYGRPTRNENVAYAPRMLQLGFRVAF